jgi:hypothetical protein
MKINASHRKKKEPLDNERPKSREETLTEGNDTEASCKAIVVPPFSFVK